MYVFSFYCEISFMIGGGNRCWALTRNNIETLTLHHNFVLKTCSYDMKKQQTEVFYKKDVLKSFTKFTGKHLCWSLYFNELITCEFCEVFRNDNILINSMVTLFIRCKFKWVISFIFAANSEFWFSELFGHTICKLITALIAFSVAFLTKINNKQETLRVVTIAT